ncbi:hypothetical protein NIES3807_29440 [Microcystis aeruginosa NIES-3807]|uniref:Uncharacterized protein n=1 Tax=Microcystis aeruginosa NIES-3807 TaxID=2517785 RepID=A0AAD3G9Q6_MICAE|nr:hypothetical protein NIES3807_29440 [Microcystis aeruginosa NIES-3807]
MGVLGIGIIYFLSYYIISASLIRGSLVLCVISLTYMSDRSLCPLCLEWFVPLAHQQYRILEYILTTEPIRKDIFPLS